MALALEQQIHELLWRSSRTLIATTNTPSAEQLCLLIATGQMLHRLGRTADILLPEFDQRHIPLFLDKQYLHLLSALPPRESLEFSLDIGNQSIQGVSHRIEDGTLRITVLPDGKNWPSHGLVGALRVPTYGALIALNCADRDQLTTAILPIQDLLFTIPTINVDLNPANESWGQVNIVEVTRQSSAEILFELCRAWNLVITPELATSLLGAICFALQSKKSLLQPTAQKLIASLIQDYHAKIEDILHQG